MSKAEAWTFGRFVWHEILTPDIGRAQAFYSELLGWKYQTFGDENVPYRVILAGGRPQGGLMATANLPVKDIPPHVMSYVSVPDVEGAARATREAGGTVLAPPFAVPGMGRLAVLADPEGSAFSVLRSETGDAPPGGRPSVGQFCWDQLHSTDPDAVARFYQAVLGWEGKAYVDGGPIELFLPAGSAGAIAAGVVAVGRGSPSRWFSYVVVDDLPAARTRAARLGGKVLVEQRAVPDVGNVALIEDDAGAALGLFAYDRG